MLIHITRQACCSQDDQFGPLEATYELPDDGTLGDLVRAVTASGFLQYSSSHTTLTAFAAGQPLVRVFGDGREPEFLVPPRRPMRSVVDPVSFAFVQSSS